MSLLGGVRSSQTMRVPEIQGTNLRDSPISFQPTFPGHNIPPEDWNHARALVTKYPPQIVLWIIREISCQPIISYGLPATRTLQYASSSNSGSGSEATFQTIPTSTTSSSSSQSSLSCDLDDLTDHVCSNEIHKSTMLLPPSERREHCVKPEDEAPSPQNLGIKQLEERWFCVFDEHKGKSFGKRSDWKKHMSNFHEPHKKAWQCPDCPQIFDQLSNFCQHHRTQHCKRNPCRHVGTAKKLKQIKRAFACGRQSCESLLSSWDEWREHVAHHLENGMTTKQWQYNTLFRNLLRRPEIHARWEAFVYEELRPYNIAARFNWRPRNTLMLKLKLEYSETILEDDAKQLVEDAYRTGLEIRSAHELLDSSNLITEPSITPSLLFVGFDQHSSQQDCNNNTFSDFQSHSKFWLPHQEQQGLHLTHQQPIQATGSLLGDIGKNIDSEQSLDAQQCLSSLDMWETDNWWDMQFDP